MNHRNVLITIQGISPEELIYLEQATSTLNEEQIKQFMFLYTGKRKSTNDILLFTLVGFLGIAGIQRFITNQIGMGIVYLLTIGFCYIGTIVDLINYKSITNEYNQKVAFESFQMMNVYPMA